MKVFSLLNSKQKRWLKTYCSKISITLDIRKFEGVIYVLKSGSQWRLLPSCFGKRKSVYHYFRRKCECQWFNRMLKHLLMERRKRIKTIKADNGYNGMLTEIVKEILSVDMQCVKSNYGTSEFIPLEGRWVVERTISWLDNFRRLCRNYEQLLSTATSMVRMAFLMILIKHI